MRIEMFQVDAFASQPFEGNPAAVCLVEDELDAELMQAIAAENNLAETAFVVTGEQPYGLRWFTPTVEVPLCGHATLASGHVLLRELGREGSVRFTTASGELMVMAQGDRLEMDLPAQELRSLETPVGFVEAVGATPTALLDAGPNLLAVYDSEHDVRGLSPDMAALMRLDQDLIATAPGDTHDCVSRFFAPKHGIPEDPVTGSAHCALAPYWCERLGKPSITAFQASSRGGRLTCEPRGDRVAITGDCVTYLRGEIEV